MPNLQISDLPAGDQIDLTAEAELAADVGSSRATKKFSYTQLAQALVLRGSVADALQHLSASARTFKGYYSAAQPNDPSLKTGDLWRQGSDQNMPLGFPWTGAGLKQWNGSVWTAAGASYTPDAWDGWADLNNGQGYYWFNGSWRLDDVNVDGLTIEQLPGGKLAVKDGGISQSKLAAALSALVTGALQKSGGAMTGSLKVTTPTADADAASKKYVDNGDNSLAAGKQDKITSTGTAQIDFLWKAPVTAGGQPGLVELASLAKKSAQDDMAEALENHIADAGNPHSVTKAQVGLGNADDTADADKPADAPQARAIVDAVGAEARTRWPGR
jgi:hypothetical protein